MHALNQYLAQALKTQRQQKKWSLDTAAKQTGVSKAMLGQIERGESSPTIATLWKIAGGFSTSLSTFLEPSISEQSSLQIRTADQLRQQPASDNMLVATLFPYEEKYGFEMYELTLLTGYQRVSEPHEPGVSEHIIVISGEMEVLVNRQWLSLQKGQALRFAADQEHGYRNLHPQTAVFHDIIHYPNTGN
ncbi:helix-turn-helix domain-containing protein [Agarivorans sp. 1_MG-2023]|uniref:helix-turn-helix domain-containing protein n=1 Tax=Agarivorans sp. 1_MG-2023 TaxID=3062634 RepID=UPI0026E42091|nr:XRE family transcriptional regulator [Agarivorans sp. 1_MG-2023]MDO6762895.1 XRE family transcriptional regulator [Agarivorans sp. 1_MG-2023]